MAFATITDYTNYVNKMIKEKLNINKKEDIKYQIDCMFDNIITKLFYKALGIKFDAWGDLKFDRDSDRDSIGYTFFDDHKKQLNERLEEIVFGTELTQKDILAIQKAYKISFTEALIEIAELKAAKDAAKHLETILDVELPVEIKRDCFNLKITLMD